uniref:Uncharacterized protein n=1 Tax=Arundo donax TaxID=35708 RepID=A0A0A8ZSI4_ARUDO
MKVAAMTRTCLAMCLSIS